MVEDGPVSHFPMRILSADSTKTLIFAEVSLLISLGADEWKQKVEV